jgi:glutathione synthase/RimK-type ligase-like ATP-grasp enzyme
MDKLAELRRASPKLLIKPAISASAELTYLIDEKDDVEDKARKILARGDLLIQPFIESIGTDGEVSLIYYFDGEGYRFLHAVGKSPAAGDFRVQADFGGSATPFQASPELRDLALQTLAALPAQVLFARVDLVDWRTNPLIGEIELIEPELFFRCDSNSARTFVQGMIATMNLQDLMP